MHTDIQNEPISSLVVGQLIKVDGQLCRVHAITQHPAGVTVGFWFRNPMGQVSKYNKHKIQII